MSEKEKIISFLSDLEDNATYEEVLCQTLTYFKIQESMANIENGELLTSEEMQEVINQC